MQIPSEKIDNFIFKNKGNLSFERANDSWGIQYEGFSNGVAYSDLDNDGDLEIITNNIDDRAAVFENRSSERNGHIKIRFEGKPEINLALGNRVYILSDGKSQMQELTLTRGFQSSVAPELHFGVGESKQIDTLKVVWTDGKVQTLTNLNVDQTLVLKHTDAGSPESEIRNESRLFATETTGSFPDYRTRRKCV